MVMKSDIVRDKGKFSWKSVWALTWLRLRRLAHWLEVVWATRNQDQDERFPRPHGSLC